MNGFRLNITALIGSFIVLGASMWLDPSIETRAREGGGWNAAYLVAPCIQATLAVSSLVGLFLALRRRQVLDALIMTAMVLLITWMQIEAGVSDFRHYSTTTTHPA